VERRRIVIALAVSATVGLAASEADAATLTVCGSGCTSPTIQGAIDVAVDGDTISISAGTYLENLVVNKSLSLVGAGAATTTILPAISSPNPCSGDSLCGGAASNSSNIILVRADNVSITGLTLDGDNPALTSGIARGGADLDARNGIITDHLAGNFDELSVEGVVVKNIYLRGLYASSGGTFTFTNNTVTNVRGDNFSIAIFNSGGAGTISGNTVSQANDAIASNHSLGVSFLNNTISNAGSGVHTDNSGDFGGTSDVIDGNVISDCDPDGYGVWTFVPDIPPQFTNNTVTNCAVGMAAFGQRGSGTTVFQGNVVDGVTKAVNSIGALASTSQFSFGTGDVSVLFAGNRIQRFETGLFVDEDQGGQVNASATDNVIAGNTAGAAGFSSLGVNAPNNWWGCNFGPGFTGCDSADTSFATDPWLVNRLTVTPDPVAAGQPATITSDLTFNSNGEQPGGTVPDGTPVGFESSPAGTIFTPVAGPTAGGLATSSFPAAAGVDACARVPADVPTAALECVAVNVSDPAASEACPATPFLLAVGGSVSITDTTAGHVDDIFSFCGDITSTVDTPDLVYAFTLPQAGTFKVDVTSLTAGYDPSVYLRTDCVTDFLCFDFGAQKEIIAGDFAAGTYFVIVDGAAGTSGDFALTVSFSAPICGDGVVNAGEQCDLGGGQPNDGCGDPGAANACQLEAPSADADACPGTSVSIPGGTTILPASDGNTTIGFNNDFSSKCSLPPGGPDRVYQIIPQITGTMTASVGFGPDGATPICAVDITDPGCWDRVLYARSTCGDAATELSCSDKGALDVETITFPVTANTPVFLFVDGYDNQSYSSGVFNLAITLQ
jgi:nitrous oxidase accessory protein NosD